MEDIRYSNLMADLSILTPTEIAAGWHFCPDWDFLLICPDYPESESCTCRNVI